MASRAKGTSGAAGTGAAQSSSPKHTNSTRCCLALASGTEPSVAGSVNDGMPRRTHGVLWFGLMALLAGVPLAMLLRPESPPTASATYVGRTACAGCHDAELAAFTGSHHDLAMQPPTLATVLGDFHGTTF